MTTTIARKLVNFAAPALVLGLVVVSQAQARINYPSGPAGTLERSVDNILLKSRADILLQNRLITTQNQTNNRLGVLQQQLAQATDPARIAFLQRQIANNLRQFQNLQVAIDRTNNAFRINLNVLFPQKDRALLVLSRLPSPRNQIAQFIVAARLQQNTYAAVMNIFLRRRPLSPAVAF